MEKCQEFPLRMLRDKKLLETLCTLSIEIMILTLVVTVTKKHAKMQISLKRAQYTHS